MSAQGLRMWPLKAVEGTSIWRQTCCPGLKTKIPDVLVGRTASPNLGQLCAPPLPLWPFSPLPGSAPSPWSVQPPHRPRVKHSPLFYPLLAWLQSSLCLQNTVQEHPAHLSSLSSTSLTLAPTPGHLTSGAEGSCTPQTFSWSGPVPIYVCW